MNTTRGEKMEVLKGQGKRWQGVAIFRSSGAHKQTSNLVNEKKTEWSRRGRIEEWKEERGNRNETNNVGPLGPFGPTRERF